MLKRNPKTKRKGNRTKLDNTKPVPEIRESPMK